jgi:hypothetical protein
MQHAWSIPSSTPSAIIRFAPGARFMMRPQLLFRTRPSLRAGSPPVHPLSLSSPREAGSWLDVIKVLNLHTVVGAIETRPADGGRSIILRIAEMRHTSQRQCHAAALPDWREPHGENTTALAIRCRLDLPAWGSPPSSEHAPPSDGHRMRSPRSASSTHQPGRVGMRRQSALGQRLHRAPADRTILRLPPCHGWPGGMPIAARP